MNASPKDVGVFIRVSTEEQAQGESPENHKLRAEAYAQAKGWNVVETYDLAGLSGKSIIKHPETIRMLDDVKNGHIEALVFSKLARLARNTRELLDIADYFEEHGADLVSLGESIDTSTPAGKLFFTVLAALGQFEREEIASRVAASVPIRAKRGMPLGGQASYGYKWVDKKLVIDEKEAPIRRKIYELFLEHRRKRTVARVMNEMGFRTRKGAKWSDTSIDRLLRDTTAKGYHIANHTKSRGEGLGWDEKPESDWVTTKVEPIVSEELWEQCNVILEKSRQRPRQNRKGRRPKHLFAGLIRCKCGQKMYVESTSPKKYTCQKCRNKIPKADLETIFEEELKNFFLSSDEISKYFAAADRHAEKQQEILQTIDQDIKASDSSIETLLKLYEGGHLTGDAFSKRFQPLEDKKNQLEVEKAEIEAELSLLRIDKFSAEQVELEGRDLFSRWQTLSEEEKRPIIDSFCDGIIVGDKEVEVQITYFPSSKELSKRQHNLMGSLTFCSWSNSHFKPIEGYPKELNHIGDHLRKVRLDRGLRQTDLVEIIGAEVHSITNWEKGHTKPSFPKYYGRIIKWIGYNPFPAPANLGEKLWQIRMIRGITAAEASKEIGVDQTTFARWERNEKEPWGICLEKLNRWLALPRNYIDLCILCE